VTPGPPVDGPRRRRPLLLVGMLALLLLIGGIAFLLLQGDDADPGASPDEPTSSAPADRGGTGQPEPSDEAPPEGTPESTPEESPEQSAAPPASSDAAAFAQDYYASLPEDTDAGWSRLSPSFQAEVGRGSYDGFWASVDDVRVEGAEEVEPGVVDVTLTYTTGGSSPTEVRRLFLEESEGGLLITDDEIVE
jgi:hypothetical protein